MLEHQTHVTTAKAEQYLNQMCRHFSHKINVQWDGQSGVLDFEIGQCRLYASDNMLRVHCYAEDADKLHEVMDVIKRHLDRFAHKESCELVWSP